MVLASGTLAQQPAATAAVLFLAGVRAGASARTGRLSVVIGAPGQDGRAERRRLIRRCATKTRTSSRNIAHATVAERPIW
ncbi:hypothetical protein SGLAM104S_08062 [Streptomyces glaucescens]